ncbi:MAG: twin-arginine translocation signal domain-containing protein [Bacteroidetes bacterium]|nr:twin-arginine translocation signal domain-containing protein [Bacteroidota bacterium]
MASRRDFIKLTAVGGVGLLVGTNAYSNTLLSFNADDDLSHLSNNLLSTWIDALIQLQVNAKSESVDFGGLMCPACGRVHGRVGDAIYPLLYMAKKKQQSKYLDATLLLYKWMEKNMSQPDGSWLNDPVKGSWKGITVFSAIALAESLRYHGALLDNQFKSEIENRLKKAGIFIYNNFSIDYGNINYPITASYGLSLIGTILDIKEFKEKGRKLAHEALGFITKKDGFLKGEGGPYYTSSGKGCYSVDLGYNVEESLPALVLYGKFTNDTEVLDAITPVLKNHMEFMLPDGAWDNSWGTRNYKWTYWGSRTSDGCQPAYALMADRDPRFYRAALKNTELLNVSTYDGLLYGGPHYLSHKVLPCVHHTMCHAKALTTILDQGIPKVKSDLRKVVLPREKVYGSRFFQDIQTHLISVGMFRATVTGYDREYAMKNGHATGGALTMLWHEKTGPLFVGSMTEYKLQEVGNMQPDNDPFSMPLTPRIELMKDGKMYMNISDLKASIVVKEGGGEVIVTTHSKLVDQDQNAPYADEIECQAIYTFYDDKVILDFDSGISLSNDSIRVVFPVVSKSTEKVVVLSDHLIHIHKNHSLVKISSDSKIVFLPTDTGRIFNFVPGLEAIPLAICNPKCRIEIDVVSKMY